jgi:peroxiredoxin
LPEITRRGASLVAISPMRPDHGRAAARLLRLSFDLLSDPGNGVAERYGLAWTLPDDLRAVYRRRGADLPKFDGDDSWRLPMPARFVIDRDATIRKVDVDPDYTRRPEPSETLAALDALARA